MPRAGLPDHYVRCAQVGKYGPATWVNVFYFNVLSAGPPTAAHVMADAAYFTKEFYDNLVLGHLSARWSTSYVNVLYIDGSGSTNRARIADASAGTSSGGDQDAQVAFLVNWQTQDPRRGGKARTYVCGVPDTAMADSAFVDTGVLGVQNTGIANWLMELLAGTGAPNGTEFQLVEMSFVDNKTDRVTAFPYAISSGSVNPVVATQRRRVDRLRPH